MFDRYTHAHAHICFSNTVWRYRDIVRSEEKTDSRNLFVCVLLLSFCCLFPFPTQRCCVCRPNADNLNKVSSRQFEYRSSNSNKVSTSNVLDDTTVDDFNTFHTRLAIFCTVCLALVFGYRKHRYNAKGIHKKNDENGVCPVTLSHKHNRLATKRIA